MFFALYSFTSSESLKIAEKPLFLKFQMAKAKELSVFLKKLSVFFFFFFLKKILNFKN